MYTKVLEEQDLFAQKIQGLVEPVILSRLNTSKTTLVEFNKYIWNFRGENNILSGVGEVSRLYADKKHLEIEIFYIFYGSKEIQAQLLNYFRGRYIAIPTLYSGRCNWKNYIERIVE